MRELTLNDLDIRVYRKKHPYDEERVVILDRYEDVLSKILTDKTIEVKSEREIWKTTGNIAIEYMSRGKLSGIATTEADWWAHLLIDGDNIHGIIMLPVPELKSKIKKMKKLGIAQEKAGGDDDTSRLVLLPITQIFHTEGELI